ncbi:MAG TPA: hypothetical protein VFW73_12215 [Lacipirellulaceae bacterium]|nr:hypothetical protein [Lacipirellulaceae bacterium]
MRVCVAILLELVFVASLLAATNSRSGADGVESLGNQLLNDLAPDASAPAAPAAPAHKHQSISEIEASLKASTPLHSFGAVENPTAQPLAVVQHGMEHAQSLLVHRRTDENPGSVRLAATAQQEVLADLDKLIAQLSKQCQCHGGQCNGDKPSDKPGTKSGKTAAGSGRTAARDSTDRLDRTTAQPVEKGNIDETVKSLWGNLPARDREQMFQSFSDEFLPKYEIDIEQYYRRLSEEQGQSPQK